MTGHWIIDVQFTTLVMSVKRVSTAAARVISVTKKFDQGLSRLMHQELHWLDIPEWVNYKLGVLTHRCLLGKVPVNLSNCCIPVSQVATRRHLRSAAPHQLTISRHRLSTYGRRAFAVAGPTMFNSLPDIYEILQSAHRPSDSRWRHIFSLPISTFSALGVSRVMRSINVRYLLDFMIEVSNKVGK